MWRTLRVEGWLVLALEPARILPEPEVVLVWLVPGERGIGRAARMAAGFTADRGDGATRAPPAGS